MCDHIAEAVKVAKSLAVSMNKEWQQILFRQLDSLHQADEWEEGDEPLQEASFVGFLNAMANINPKRYPGLGLSHGGNLLAAWTTEKDRLTMEFTKENRVRWVLSRNMDNKSVEQLSGDVTVNDLRNSLSNHNTEHWFSAG